MQRRRSCPVRDKIMRKYDQELLGAPLWCTTQQEEGLWIQGVNVVVPQRRVFIGESSVCAHRSLHQMKALIVSIWGLCTTEGVVRLQVPVVERGEKATTSPVELSYPKAKHRLERRWTRRSTTVPQRRIYQSRRKGCRCRATDSRAMGLAAPW
ncbi:hypothetical protein BHM03_00008329 [Ensete ventricosum]|nr:hypothetical protein BHM03_00008329 [Ensete ventricosum]